MTPVRTRAAALVAAVALCAPLTVGPSAAQRQNPASEQWEMVVNVVADTGQESSEPTPGGSDRSTAQAHTEAHVTAVFEVTQVAGGVQSTRMISVRGSGSTHSTSEHHFKSVSRGNPSTVIITTTNDDSATSTGVLVPSETKPDEMSFVVNDTGLVATGTLHFRVDNTHHARQLTASPGGSNVPHEQNQSSTSDSGSLFDVEGDVTAAMTRSRRFTATTTEDVDDPRMLKGGMHGRTVTTVDIHPLGPKEPLDLIVEAADYEHWLPKGSVDGSPTPADSIAIRATLRTKSGKPVPPGEQADRMVFQLSAVSHEPGTSSLPLGAKDDGLPDLRFVKEQNLAELHIVDARGQRAEKLDSSGVAVANLSSFDWGAWGDLTVTAELVDGTTVTGHVMNGPVGPIPFPFRTGGSKIAKAWKVANGVDGKPDDADDDDSPAGNGFAGDGFTLYEEYRGFVCGGAHVRTDPRKKDVFIRNEIGPAADAGLGEFRTASKLEVHDCLKAGEMPASRVMNANHGAGAHRVDQHAMRLVQGQQAEAEKIGTPARVDKVMVSAPPKGSGRARQEWDASIAHELLHDCHVNHHGDGDRIPVTWVKGPDGSLVERAKELNGAAGDKRIIVKNETGVVLTLADPNLAGLFENGGNYSIGLYVAVWSGEHSGYEDCLMRYSTSIELASGVLVTLVADRADPRVRYLIPRAEHIGTGLCEKKTGTGVNAAGRTPLQWHGDATAGACVKQLVVNDASPG